MCWPGDAQESERGPDEDGEDGQEDPQRQEGVDKQEGVQAVEEAVGHELFQLPTGKGFQDQPCRLGISPRYPHECVHLLPLAGVPLLVVLQHVASRHLAGQNRSQKLLVSSNVISVLPRNVAE